MLHPVSAALSAGVALVPLFLAYDPGTMDGTPPNSNGPVITDDRQVTQLQLQCVRDSFATYFSGGASTTSHSTIGPAQVDVGWTSLKTALDAVHVTGDTVRAVRLHYGLKTGTSPHNYRFTIGVEVLKLRHTTGDNWTVIPVVDGFYTVDGSGQLKPQAESGWSDDETYFSHTFVRRASNFVTFDQVDANDTRHFTFPWENELLPLHDQNTCDSIRFVCIAEPGERDGSIDKDMRHHLCAVALDNGAEVINNGTADPSRPYKNRAADVGCPCPSLCDIAVFPQHGTSLRNCH